MQRGDLVRVNLQRRRRSADGAPIWDLHPWKARAIIQERLREGDLLLILEQTRAAEDPESGASLVLSPTSGITGWVVDDYLDTLELAEILTDVEVV